MCACVCLPYTPSSHHFLSSVDRLATAGALVRPSKLLSQLGRVWVGGGTMGTRPDGERQTDEGG